MKNIQYIEVIKNYQGKIEILIPNQEKITFNNKLVSMIIGNGASKNRNGGTSTDLIEANEKNLKAINKHVEVAREYLGEK